MRKLLAIAILAIAPFCVAQSFTTVTATSCIGLGDGSNLPAGTFQVQATDANDGDIPFRAGGAFQSLKQGVTRNVVNGSLSSSLQIGTPANSSPLDILYRITITDTSTKKVTVYRKVPISGTTWDFCAMDTGTLLPTIPHSVSIGPPGPAPTASNIQSALTSLSGCSDSGKAYNPQTNTCLPSAGGPTTVVYASQLATTPIASIVLGSSSTGAFDNAPALNAALAAMTANFGRLVIDGKYAVGATLKIPSGVAVECTPGNGFIELPNMNADMFENATEISNPSACTANVSDGIGNGGFIVSHQCDHDIAIRGCILNYNATQSVTNSNKKEDTAGLWITGIKLLGVNNFIIQNNIMYDSATFNLLMTNSSNGLIDSNQITVPLSGGIPAIHNQDGIHCIGPCSNLLISNTMCMTGDDCIALNANDGNMAFVGDSNFPFAQWPGFGWGPITDVTVSNTHVQNSYAAVRMLSVGQLIDRVHVLNTWGSTFDTGMQISDPYGVGAGNFGCIDVDGFNVQRGTVTNSGVLTTINIKGNFNCLNLSRLIYPTALTNYPYLIQAGIIPNFSISGLSVSNPSGVQNTTSLIQTNGTLTNFALYNVTFNDNPSNTGTLVGGTSVPATITASNYAGPNRLLASGYAPAHENGDAFINTYPAASVTYVNTTFNEASSGTLVAGTTPAICTNGCSGPWVASSGGPAGSGALSYTTNSATLSGICTGGGPDIFCPVTIDVGAANYTAKLTMSGTDSNGNFAIVPKWTDNANFVTFLGSSAGWTLYDVVAGTTTAIMSNVGMTEGPGLYTIAVNGTTMSLTNPAGTTLSGTVSGSNTASNFGINDNSTTIVSPNVMTSLVITNH